MSSQGMESEQIHDRSPIFLDEESARLWLSNSEIDQVLPPLLNKSHTVGRKEMMAYEVSSFVSNVRNEGSDCCKPVKEYKQKLFETGIGRYLTRVPKRRKRAIIEI